MSKSNDVEPTVPDDVCALCGTKMMLEDGILVCPHCQGEINYFGEDADEENN